MGSQVNPPKQRAELSRAEPRRASQIEAGQSKRSQAVWPELRAKPGLVEPILAVPSQAGMSRAEPGLADRNGPQPSQDEPPNRAGLELGRV